VYSQRTVLGHVPLQGDHSVKVMLPAGKPVILELIDGNGAPVFTMTEEHQLTKNEYITPGAPRALFNGICAGCHGSISGEELDVAVTADALTGASVSMSRDQPAASLQQ
jgi:mono/diheme cytochrome c family protein